MRDWHADFYAQRQPRPACVDFLFHGTCQSAGRLRCAFPGISSQKLTATGFGDLNSNQCAVGAAKLLAYQKAVYRNIAQMQATVGLTPSVQYGEFLWWYIADPNGKVYYDAETSPRPNRPGRPLQIFMTPNDDPTVNSSADALFLRNRLRDYVSALVADIRSAFPTVKCEVLWPYDVNYPTPVGGSGGQLNRFVNLPVEWQRQSTSASICEGVEVLRSPPAGGISTARQAIDLFPGLDGRSALSSLSGSGLRLCRSVGA